MPVLFSMEQFLGLVTEYNRAIWPLQLVAYGLGALAVILAVHHTRFSGRAVSGILSLLWLWVGLVFGGIYFPRLYPSAIGFGILFVLEAALLLVAGVLQGRVSFRPRGDLYGVVGEIAILYGAIVYPAIEWLLRRGYPQALLPGVVPCPTAIFTLGLLLWSERPLPKRVLILPVLYSLTGLVPFSLGLVEDLGLVIAGVLAAVLILWRDRPGAREPEVQQALI